MAKKSKENELKNVQKKIKKLQYAFGNIEKEHWEEIETLFDKIEKNKDLEKKY
ncbi:MAG: hypothetical protein UIH41_09160 [Treponemataceae bacterium]|nr:hypothetical protein [Treponemataceae bacterium]